MPFGCAYALPRSMLVAVIFVEILNIRTLLLLVSAIAMFLPSGEYATPLGVFKKPVVPSPARVVTYPYTPDASLALTSDVILKTLSYSEMLCDGSLLTITLLLTSNSLTIVTLLFRLTSPSLH